MQDKLNTMDSFEKEGFKIERDGQVITLTKLEMADFRFFDKAVTGKTSLEWYEEWKNNITDEDKKMIEKMKEDVFVCERITEYFEDKLHENSCDLEFEVVDKYVKQRVYKVS